MKKILLSLSLVTVALVGKAQTCSELFISEYCEGSSNNKAMEFYNPTNATISMSNYRLVRYSNGSFTGTDSTDLVGSVNSYSTFVLVNGTSTGTAVCSPTLQAMAQQLDHAYPNPTAMNGDDALILVKISPYTILDIFGKVGEQPTTAWSDIAPYTGGTGMGKWWTKDHSLQRKQTVLTGVKTNPSAFNVKLEWDSLPNNNWTNVGIHTCDCKPVGINESVKTIFLKVFPNPSNGNEIAFISDKNIKEINILNAIGQVVLTHTAITSENTIVLKNVGLAKGIYYTIIKTDSGNKTEKLIIQ
jgi:predicted extracellular nuclease